MAFLDKIFFMSILADKSYKFAIRIVKLNEYLTNEKKEYTLSKQLLRSGTAIGALISEAQYAQSNADFISKMHIGLKEANESRYWIRLLNDCNYLTENITYDPTTQNVTYLANVTELLGLFELTLELYSAELVEYDQYKDLIDGYQFFDEIR